MTTGPLATIAHKKSLTIGIVSDKAHVQTLTGILKKRGHKVLYFSELGNKQRLSDNVDVIVCRVLGASHAATAICFEENRRGTRPVVFRNGTTSIVQQIELIEQGSWAPDWRLMNDGNPDQLQTDPEEQTPEQLAEIARQEQIALCRAGIHAMLDKGNIFCTALAQLNNLDRAKDVVCRVSYSTRDRVKRTGVIDAMRAFKQKASFISEQVAAVAAEGGVFTYTMHARNGDDVEQETVLAKEELTNAQFEEFVKALDTTSKRTRYSVERPVVEPKVVNVPDVQESEPAPVVNAPPAPVVVVPVAVEVVTPVAPPTLPLEQPAEPDIFPEYEKEIGDCLEMVANALDMYGIKAIGPSLLAKFGLAFEGGTLSLNIVHMASPSGACCNGASTRVSYKSSSVTCKACRQTPIFQYMAWHEANAK